MKNKEKKRNKIKTNKSMIFLEYIVFIYLHGIHIGRQKDQRYLYILFIYKISV